MSRPDRAELARRRRAFLAWWTQHGARRGYVTVWHDRGRWFAFIRGHLFAVRRAGEGYTFEEQGEGST